VRPLGDTIEAASLQGKFMGALPPGDPPTALAAWRDSGGTLEIQRASLQWGALALELSGTLALDKDMQPIAAIDRTIVDHDALVDAAIAAGMVPAKRAQSDQAGARSPRQARPGRQAPGDRARHGRGWQARDRQGRDRPGTADSME